MDLHVPKVGAHVLVDKREFELLQLLADLHHGRGVAAQAQHVATQAVQVLDIPLVQGAVQHVVFQGVDFAMDRFTHRLVVLDHEVEQGVEHEVFAMLQQQRARLAALAHMGIRGRVAVAAGDDVARAGEDVGLDELQHAVLAHRRVGHDEQRVTEGLELGPAVFFQGVFNGQFVQVELALQVGQLQGTRLFKADPDEVPGFCRPGRAFIQGDIGDFLAGAVDRGRNDSTHDCDSLLLDQWQ